MVKPLRLAAVATASAALLALPGAAAAAPLQPQGRSLELSPTSASHGDEITVSGRVANRSRRARAGRVVVRVGRRDAAVRLRSIRLGTIAAGERARFELTADLPAAVPTGRHPVVVCVRRACRVAGRLTVRPPATAPGVTPPAPPAPVTEAPPAQPPAAPPADPPPGAPTFVAGARSGGDVLFPQIGNGGYDAQHYDLSFDFDATTGTVEAVTTMTAVATQNLWQLSMDLEGFDVTSVAVGAAGNVGTPVASFSRELPAAASANAENVASKLVITPQFQIRAGARFDVTVRYAGTPTTVEDPDGSFEGWFPTDTGGAVVCQPIGCQGVYPSNNIPYDKATFDVAIEVPDGLTGIASGELAGTSTSGGRTTWRWSMDQPVSTYLTTATIGDFELQQSTAADGTPIYDFVDRASNGASPAFSAGDLALIQAQLDAQEAKVEFLEQIFGPYPFGSYGAMVVNAPDVPYALEVATKPFYPDSWAWADGETFAHELMHQWIGNSVTYAQIRDMWIHEGMATWIVWHWAHEEAGGQSPADHFADLYADPGVDWSWPVAEPDGQTLFLVYDRGGMTLEALRQIVGDADYFAILRQMADRFRYSTISTAQFMALAEEVSGRDLDQFFADWLYGTTKPPLPATYG